MQRLSSDLDSRLLSVSSDAAYHLDAETPPGGVRSPFNDPTPN